MKTSLHVITLLVLSASPLALPLNAQEDLEISEFFESTAEVGNYRVFANVFPDETGKVFDFIFYIRQAETDEPYTGGVTILFIHSGSDRIERSVEKGAVDEPNIYRTRHAFEKEGLYFVRLHFSPMGEKLEAQFPLTVGHPGAKVSGTVVTAILLGIVGLLWYGGIRSRFDILRIRFINRLVKMRPFQFYLRLPLVLMCLVLIPAGLFGNQYAGMNSATIVIWVIWWTAIVFAITLLGKVWCTVCPWLAVADWIQKLTFWRKKDRPL
ncbi:MAG: 4Fe-4S binding protein, partial [bacterium]